MPKSRTVLALSEEERERLREMTRKGVHGVREVKRAAILLASGEAGLSNAQIAERVGVCLATVENVQRRYRTGGIERALKEAPRSGQPKKIGARQEAQISAIACSQPPAGHVRWTLQMIADRVVELRYLEAISDESVRLTLKKTSSNLGKRSVGASVG